MKRTATQYKNSFVRRATRWWDHNDAPGVGRS